MTDENPTPALFDHAVRVYETMRQQATKQTVDDKEALVYEGHLTNLFRDLDIANPYYTRIMKVLKGQMCLLQLRRGGGTAMSKWLILEPPNEETFREIMERRTPTKGKGAVMEQQLRDLKRVVLTLQANSDEFERQLQQLNDEFMKLRDEIQEASK